MSECCEHSSIPVRPWVDEVGGVDDEIFEQIECKDEDVSEEAKKPEVLKRPRCADPQGGGGAQRDPPSLPVLVPTLC